uniref:Extradiol ring-cleavage dioxygenase class III enzyme subunit B domain-containing protein n=1 Tax=Palpitomonas bilix TaxID=652834 RepID=A0A7S3LT44_9EUKA
MSATEYDDKIPEAPDSVWRLTSTDEGDDGSAGADDANLFTPTAVPPLFISHGAPYHALDHTSEESLAWKRLGALYRRAGISGVVVISAHWEEDYPTVTVGDRELPTIHDFYGFPRQLYEVKYPALCDSELAERVGELLAEAGMQPRAEKERGIDHGTWVPLIHMFPHADVAVVQVSLKKGLSPDEHWKLGKALSQLKTEGILVMGSGAATHNLQSIDFGGGEPPLWAKEFNDWLHDVISGFSTVEVARQFKRITSHPAFSLAHPRSEHIIPILVAAAAAIGDADEDEKARASVARPSVTSTGDIGFSFSSSDRTGVGKRAIQKWSMRTMSMDAYVFFPFEEE